MIIVWGSVDTVAQRYAEALQLSLEHVVRSRGEPGCISHTVMIDAENDTRLNFFEEWEDLDALQKHFAVDESVRFAARLTDIAARPPEVRIFESTRVS